MASEPSKMRKRVSNGARWSESAVGRGIGHDVQVRAREGPQRRRGGIHALQSAQEKQPVCDRNEGGGALSAQPHGHFAGAAISPLVVGHCHELHDFVGRCGAGKGVGLVVRTLRSSPALRQNL